MSQKPKKHTQNQQKKTQSQKPAEEKHVHNMRPLPQNRKKGGKKAAEIIISLLLVAAVGYGGFHAYRSLKPISQDTENLSLVPGEDGETVPDASGEQTIYENIAVQNTQVNAGDLILVNDANAYVDNNASEIVSIYDKKTEHYHVSGTETSLRETAVDALNRMLEDFYVAKNHSDIIVISGYRTKDQQQKLYDEDLAQTGESTSTRVALPGHSEHESGYSLDVSLYEDGVQSDYDGTGDYSWIDENCDHYGYILRYAADKAEITGIQAEPWHYRYVGEPHATYMKENNLCLEEYLTQLKDYTSDNRLQIVNWDGEIYEVYYVAADMAADSTYVLVPPDQDYTISGNNSDGFIITVDTGRIQSFEENSTAETTAPEGQTVPEETQAETAAAPEENSEEAVG
ncbi:D-alanyl-D-alanine carboxypeptidase family protein [uncultured Ruminococcus sp.]|jgi:D-alanyl-D-alanine carboxypeptidase|uniref:M15 family metallopeptidase n=1 Tax=uncultured Ruminococcus sp. TaxID=165186 RepID=UPI0026070B2C|nr:M15 family metallopeptidase [uncultured Ruminococcus sp.]